MFGNLSQFADIADRASTAIINTQLNTNNLVRPAPGVTISPPVIVVEGPHFDITQSLIGLVVLGVLLVIFFFVKRFFTNTMITGNASIQKADLAGWALFMMLFALSATAIFGFIGSLWNFITMFGPIVGLNVVIILFFIFTFLSAQRSKRLI